MKQPFKLALSGVAATAALCTISLSTAPLAFAQTNSANTTTQNTTSSAPTLVALGDSITFGYNLPDTKGNTVPSQSAYPFLIGQTDHLNVSDLGVPGWTSTDLLSALSSANFDRAIHSADVVTIDIGSNDLLHLSAPLIAQATLNPGSPLQLTSAQQQAFQQAITTFGSNLGKIVSTVRGLTHAPILVYNLYDPFPTGTNLNVVTEQLEASENGAISQVAAAVPGVTVVDAHKAFATHQLDYVRVAQNDVHPTAAGQGVLASIGETAMLPYLAQISKQAPSSFRDALLAGSLSAGGGSLTGMVNGSQVTLAVPGGSLSQGTEVDFTSQPSNSLSSIDTQHTSVAAEIGLNFMAGIQLSKPYQLTLVNKSIPANGAVYQITAGGQLTAVPGAKISAGQAVISASEPGDFVVLAPVSAVVTGVTKPVTGLPFERQGAAAMLLLLAGSGLVWFARRPRKEA
ncbi:SGNH/GDSL hydrolase family protein [Alicyclobacillus curvatus]|nr:SGNH/GDSL hydrolase family protein [Alicyclobacillus curvatus]